MDRIDAMRLFVRVAELGSFSAVAQQMGVARSVVTRQIAALESHLGAKLLARSTRRLSLTPGGAAYLEKCRVILNLIDVAETGLAEERQIPRGLIRLSLPLVYGLKYLAPLLLEFAGLYPEVELDMEFSDRRARLIEEGIDIAVRITTRLEPGDVVRLLGSGRMKVVASADYLARHGEPRHPEELIHHQCLGYTEAAGGQRWSFIVDGVPQAFPIRPRIRANNGEVLREAAIAGMGIIAQPDFIVAQALADGRLVPVLADWRLPPVGIHALYASRSHLAPKVRSFIDYLVERLGADAAGPGSG